MTEFPKVVHWAVPVFLLSIALELVWVHRAKSRQRIAGYRWADSLCSLSLGLGNLIVGALTVQGQLWLLDQVWEYRIFDLGSSWGAILACLLLDDLRYYWHHRLSHELRFCWAAHVTHHSSGYYNYTTALRQPWTTFLTGLVVLTVPLVWLGFSPKMVIFCYGLNLIYQFWVHTEAVDRMPAWFEWVFNTPSHHRVHHARNHRYLDANYGGILILWDRLFGSFIPETDEHAVDYGLVHPLTSFNPIIAALHEWKAIVQDALTPGLGLSQRLRYVVGAPGWSHDGRSETAKVLRRKATALLEAET